VSPARAIGAALCLALAASCSFDPSGASGGDENAPSVDAAAPPDASLIDADPMDPSADAGDACLAACVDGACVDGTCVINCPTAQACPDQLVCPAGIPCRIRCTGEGSCPGGIDCSGASTCTVSCSGTDSCAGEIACGPGRCSVTCSSDGSCQAGTSCPDACACEVDCSGPDACATEAECPAMPCDTGAGCTSEPSGACDQC
jgi:hypothetical protein